MAYERLNLKDDEVLTADHIKHIEDGIIGAVPAYTAGDYGKVLSATEAGLVWVEMQAGETLPAAEGVEFG